MCKRPWSASRTFSPAPMRRRTALVLRSVPKWASSTQTLCCPGRCCSPSAQPAKSKTSCRSKLPTSSVLQSKYCFYCTATKVSIVRMAAWLLCRHLPKLQMLLESDDVNMRIAAGETIALLFELARDMDAVSFPATHTGPRLNSDANLFSSFTCLYGSSRFGWS